ncbi:IS200/IS605 family element transposase accessory protein TnpB [Candidatus Micrarchaeota archaeon]|nr:IS200/IS605 family element transposase accessory protein TnpB [Candidatus Micrarchaeota archaeon]
MSSVLRVFKYRLYPSKAQVKAFEETLETCRTLYNNALAERKNAWESERKSFSYLQQQNKLPALKRFAPELAGVHSQVLQNTLRRLDAAFKGFFRRVKNGEPSGYPRFKGVDRYDSFTFPQFGNGVRLEGKKLRLSKIGLVSVKLHRGLPKNGVIKACTIKRDVDRWYACLTIEKSSSQERREAKRAVGVDVGLKNLVALSNGELVKNPRWLEECEARLAVLQQRLSHKQKGSRNRSKQRLRVARLHRRVRNQRRDFLHKLSRRLVDDFDLIKFENLNIRSMLKNRFLAKSIGGAGWFELMFFVRYKAEEAGTVVEFVEPQGTSVKCSECGFLVPKTLSVRTHSCPNCGSVEDRDINAAKNILYTVGLTGSACRGTRSERAVEAGSPRH